MSLKYFQTEEIAKKKNTKEKYEDYDLQQLCALVTMACKHFTNWSLCYIAWLVVIYMFCLLFCCRFAFVVLDNYEYQIANIILHDCFEHEAKC